MTFRKETNTLAYSRDRKVYYYDDTGDDGLRSVVLGGKPEKLSPPSGASSMIVVSTRKVCGIPLWSKEKRVSYS